MNLIAYLLDGHSVDIRPAPVEREWMEATDQRFAYRCLPLNIANAFGWEVHCPSAFVAIWDGGATIDSIKIRPAPGTIAPAISHFANGILTFHIPCLFRTDPTYDLMVLGPLNRPKDGISPLSGVIETDWAPYTFTMNWKFTRPGLEVCFRQGEPFCHIFPIRRGDIEEVRPQCVPISEAPEILSQYQAWQQSRRQFNKDLQKEGTLAQSEKWQKYYYRGLGATGERAGTADHRTRIKLAPFSTKS